MSASWYYFLVQKALNLSCFGLYKAKVFLGLASWIIVRIFCALACSSVLLCVLSWTQLVLADTALATGVPLTVIDSAVVVVGPSAVATLPHCCFYLAIVGDEYRIKKGCI